VYLVPITSGPLTGMINSRNGASKSTAVSTHILDAFCGCTLVSPIVRAIPCCVNTFRLFPYMDISPESYGLIEERRPSLQQKSTLCCLVRCMTILNSSLATHGSMGPVPGISALNHGGLSFKSRSSITGGFVRPSTIPYLLTILVLLPKPDQYRSI
jgi:hypothetical protein